MGSFLGNIFIQVFSLKALLRGARPLAVVAASRQKYGQHLLQFRTTILLSVLGCCCSIHVQEFGAKKFVHFNDLSCSAALLCH